jgi:hypothetical protein
LAWLGTGLVVLTFPFVARATFDEYDGGSDAAPPSEDAIPSDAPSPPREDAPIVDGGLPDATGTQADGARTTFGDDAGGISCAVGRGLGYGSSGSGSADEATLAACASCAAVGLICARRRARSRRRGANDA